MNPRSVFERLFGTVDPSLDPTTRARRALYRRSMLDLTRDDAKTWNSISGLADRRRMDEYLTSVREVEAAHRGRRRRIRAFRRSRSLPAFRSSTPNT